MKILASDNIPFVVEAFSRFGEIRVKAGRQIVASDLDGVEVFLARSTTRIDASLLANSPVKFVSTATAGTDHVDVQYLRRRGIVFASAAGSNAISVGEYVTAALLHVAAKYSLTLEGMTLGIVGCGHTGSAVAQRARALGLKCALHDPPLMHAGRLAEGRPIEDVLECDIVTFHVPLTVEGPDATWRMVDEEFLARLKPGAVFVNAARGGIVDDAALVGAIDAGRLTACVLDVWADEPRVNVDLMRRLDIATPHIAGHSYNGKVRGTEMNYRAFCEFMGVSPTFDFSGLIEPLPAFRVDLAGRGAVHEAVSHAYDIMEDDRALRKLSEMADSERAGYFERLRSEYRLRLEFSHVPIVLDLPNDAVAARLEALEFPLTVIPAKAGISGPFTSGEIVREQS